MPCVCLFCTCQTISGRIWKILLSVAASRWLETSMEGEILSMEWPLYLLNSVSRLVRRKEVTAGSGHLETASHSFSPSSAFPQSSFSTHHREGLGAQIHGYSPRGSHLNRGPGSCFPTSLTVVTLGDRDWCLMNRKEGKLDWHQTVQVSWDKGPHIQSRTARLREVGRAA